MISTLRSLLFAMTSMSTPPAPPSPDLAFPVDCTIGGSCLIQKLVDHDPGPGRRDYRCGALTTDGHDGVDIRLRTMADMRTGFAVVAAQAGVVLRTRDGEPDSGVKQSPATDGKMAGNAVIIDHGKGWQTQYSHLRQGSVRVRPGQHVAARESIGLVGLSGNSEFPHLHFTVRYRDIPVDPFVGVGQAVSCHDEAKRAWLWAPAAATMLDYQPAAVITAGLASEVPPRAVVHRDPAARIAGADAPLILWADAIGAKAGDRQEFTIVGPNGRVVHSQLSDIADGGLSWFAYSGKPAPASGWAPGRYTGRYVLRRNNVVVARADTASIIE